MIYKSLFSNQLTTHTDGTIEYQFDHVDSTNTEAETHLKQLTAVNLPQLQTGIVYTAKTQSFGQGQYGRTWISDTGGLYYTLMKRYPNYVARESTQIVSSIGRLIAATVGSITHLPVEHISPNDLYIGEKKLGGILIKSTPWHGYTIAIVGIGINLNQPSFPDPIKLTATSCYLQTSLQFTPTEFSQKLTRELKKFLQD